MCFIEKKIPNITPPPPMVCYGGGGGGNVDYSSILNYFTTVFLQKTTFNSHVIGIR